MRASFIVLLILLWVNNAFGQHTDTIFTHRNVKAWINYNAANIPVDTIMFVTGMNYPSKAKEKGCQGMLQAEVTIDTSGKVIMVTIIESSITAEIAGADCSMLNTTVINYYLNLPSLPWMARDTTYKVVWPAQFYLDN